MQNPDYQKYQGPVIEDVTGVNKFYGKVYGFFGVGLAISGLAAYLCAMKFPLQTANFIKGFPLGIWGIFIVEMILVVLLSAKAVKNPALSVAGFIIYALINGVFLSSLFYAYNVDTIYKAFASAAVTFGVAAVFGVFTKRDLSMWGRVLIIALVGMIITTLLNVFLFKSSGLDLGLSLLSVVIFTGLTAYDNQMIRSYYAQTKGIENTGVAAYCALQLYLDFINLLLSFLRIFGNND